tara:strand:+ start:312 stop:512 length:201 start_codon:yes stop_codon:yes gene_type:complete
MEEHLAELEVVRDDLKERWLRADAVMHAIPRFMEPSERLKNLLSDLSWELAAAESNVLTVRRLVTR